MADAQPPPSSGAIPKPAPQQSNEAVHQQGPRRPFMHGNCIPEFMHQVSRIPGFRSFEVTFRWNFHDDMDDHDHYYYHHHDYYDPSPRRFKHMGLAQQHPMSMLRGLPPQGRGLPGPPPPMYHEYGQLEPPMAFRHHPHHQHHHADYDHECPHGPRHGHYGGYYG